MLLGSTWYSRDNKQIRLLRALSAKFWMFLSTEVPQPVRKSLPGSDNPHYEHFFLVPNCSSLYCSLCLLTPVLLLVHLQEASCSVFPVAIHWVIEDSNWISPLPPWVFLQLLLLHHATSPLTAFLPAASKDWRFCSWSQGSKRELAKLCFCGITATNQGIFQRRHLNKLLINIPSQFF